jgi:hypothetical protein
VALSPSSSGGGGGGGGPTQLALVTFAATVNVTGSEVAPTDVVSAGTLAFDGVTPVHIEFFAVQGRSATVVNALVGLNLWDGNTDLGRICLFQNGGSGTVVFGGITGSRYLTPAAGSHTYKIRGWASTGTAVVVAGAGGAGVELPGFIRIVTA